MRLAGGTHLDLIVTDLYMPDKDGLEVIREARKSHSVVPIIAVSGGVGAEHMLRVAKRLGAARIFQKPFSSEQLVNAVAAVVDVSADIRF